MKKLVEADLFGNRKKCEFDKTTVSFLGYQLSPSSVVMEEARVSTILDWPMPASVTQIQEFVEFWGSIVGSSAGIVRSLCRCQS